jgi:hypothetical protein
LKYHRPYTLLLFLALLQLAGCAVAPDNSGAASRQRNANLSDAMRQANGSAVTVPKAGYSRERSAMQVEQHKPRDVALDLSLQAEMSDAPDVSNGVSFEYSQIQYTSGPLKKGQFYALYFEQFDEERTGSLGYRLSYGTYTLPETGIAGGAFESVNSVSIDTFVKFYGMDMSVFTAPYLLASLGYGNLAWSYRQPITDSSGYTFTGDALDYTELRVGLGAELGRYGILQLSVYAGPVARFYLGRTREGFNNDVFADRTDLTWGGTLGVRF